MATAAPNFATSEALYDKLTWRFEDFIPVIHLVRYANVLVAAPQSQAAAYYLAWTWCSTCCPQGPDFCPQVGMGEGPTPDEAAYYAAEMCVRNGGVPQTCSANVQYLSADEIAELGY